MRTTLNQSLALPFWIGAAMADADDAQKATLRLSTRVVMTEYAAYRWTYEEVVVWIRSVMGELWLPKGDWMTQLDALGVFDDAIK